MPIREIALDTETTGLSAVTDRIIEIAAIEMIDQIPTGRVYHQLINPERSIPAEATAIHNLRDADVADKPKFAQIVDAFREFIGGDDLVIHNAPFDMRMLNAELARLGLPPLQNKPVDTVVIARKQFPGSRATLDALLNRFNIDASERSFHGALIDTKLLCKVYVCLLGKHMLIPDLPTEQETAVIRDSELMPLAARHLAFPRRPARNPSPDEMSLHSEFIGKIKDCLWIKNQEERIA